MNIIKTLCTTTLALAMTSGLAGAAEYTMRISHQFPPSHHTAIYLQQFAKDVAADTQGRVEVQLFGSAQLYKPDQQHAAVASGQIESAVILSIQWGSSLPDMAVTQIPYLASSPAKQKAFIGSDAAHLLEQEMLQKGVRNIGWIVDSNDLIFTSSSRLLDAPDKFKGIKMRGLNKVFDAGLIAMGAIPVSMSGSEVYQALQTGVIDAALTGIQAASARKYYEVQKYGAATPMYLIFDNLVVNPAWWDGLPKDIRAEIQKAADKTVQASLIKDQGVNPEDMAKLNQEGMQAVVLTDDQVEAFKKVMLPAVRQAFLKSATKDGQKLIDMIDAL